MPTARLGGAYLFSLLLNDVEGMKDFFARDSTRKRLAAREDEMREQAGAWVELPISLRAVAHSGGGGPECRERLRRAA